MNNMKKLISLSVSLPIAAASLLGVAGSASAGVIGFTTDQLNFVVGLQIVGTRAAGPGGVPAQNGSVGAFDQLGTFGDTKGINNGDANFDLLWLPTQESGGFLTPSNRIVDQTDATGTTQAYCLPVDANLRDAQVGECGRGSVSGDQAGSFAGILNNDIATLRNIDQSVTVIGTPFNFDAPWMRLFSNAAADPMGIVRRFDFMLTSSALSIVPDTNTVVSTFLQGSGMVRQTDTTCSAAQIAANVSSCVTYGDFIFLQTGLAIFDFRDPISNIFQAPSSIFVTPQVTVPEPGSIIGLLALIGVGVGSLASKKKPF